MKRIITYVSLIVLLTACLIPINTNYGFTIILFGIISLLFLFDFSKLILDDEEIKRIYKIRTEQGKPTILPDGIELKTSKK